MSWARGLWYRIRNRAAPVVADRETDDEIAFHLEMATRANRDRGMSSDEAGRTSRHRFGDVTHLRDDLRTARGGGAGGGLAEDLRIAFRRLARDRAFAILAVLTLALGIGWTTAIFSVLDAALLRPLSYPRPEQLVHLWERKIGTSMNRGEASALDLADFRTSNPLFTGVAGYRPTAVALSHAGTLENTSSTFVDANFFAVLGVRPALGRDFRPEENIAGAGAHVVVLSDQLWQSHFAGNPAVVGTSIDLDGEPYTVIGILPPGFRFALSELSQLWIPLATSKASPSRGNRWIRVVARLSPRVTVEGARHEFDAQVQRLAAQYPEMAGRGGDLVPLRDEIVGANRPLLLALIGASSVLLLIACANVAGLLLIRMVARRRELAVRSAMGASQWRVLRQLLVENVVLGLAGGAAGIVVAGLALKLLMAQVPPAMLALFPFVAHAQLNARVLVFACGIAFATGILAGLWPALATVRKPTYEVLRQSGRGSTGIGGRWRGAFITVQLALTLMLLTGSALLGQSLFRLLHVSPGFRAERLLTFSLDLTHAPYTAAGRLQAVDEVKRRLEALPGVTGVAIGSDLPLEYGSSADFLIEGEPVPTESARPYARVRNIEPGYFSALGVPVLSGRGIIPHDQQDAAHSVVVNNTFVATMLHGSRAIGRVVRMDATSRYAIVGVVGDLPVAVGLAPLPAIYFAYDSGNNVPGALRIGVRTTSDPALLAPRIQPAIAQAGASLAPTNLRTMTDAIDRSREVFFRRFPMMLVGVFAIVGLFLAVIGIYGTIAYTVATRTREIGIRSALGASSSMVVRLAMREGLLAALAGVALGTVLTGVASQAIGSLLYDIGARDILTYLATAALLFVAALLATLLPALRAAKIQPTVALSQE